MCGCAACRAVHILICMASPETRIKGEMGHMAEGHTVEGRQFRTKADYEAALRDKKKIDAIKAKVNLNNPRDVRALYEQMQGGVYRFESMVGNDFDDQIYELMQKHQNGEGRPDGKKAKGKAGENVKREQTQRKQMQKSQIRKNPVQGNPMQRNQMQKKQVLKEDAEQTKGTQEGLSQGRKLSLKDFDQDMQKEITAQLKVRERRRKWLVALCSLGAVIGFGYFFLYYIVAERTNASYQELASLKNSEVLAEPVNKGEKKKTIVVRGEQEEIVLPDVLDDYKTLYNKNKRLIGWLKIDDTIIDYPVMQTSNNEYYLDHNFNQEKDNNGSIFMDKDCVAYPRSQNLILYGHHMKSGKMFGDLEKYAKESYYEKHSIINFDTIYEKSVYQVMYVFRTRVLKENEIAFKYYQFIEANSWEEFNSYMNEMAGMSLYDTGVTAEYGDELLTLSTCDHSQTDGRFVVVAKRIR